MFIELVLLTIVLLALAMLGLGLGMLLRKNGKFPETSVGKNRELRKKGIMCATHEEILVRRKVDGRTGCSAGCGCH